ncbi:type IV secretory system conjugative DNA transfer family protein [Bradyrhizobium cenepequi]
MNAGLEVGINPATERPIRIQVEGNLVTIAPPRSGKTGGFVIPNLTFPEPKAWAGPAVVIDPKGDAFRAVKRRRETMGKTIRCLDPLNYVGGADRWNPLSRVDTVTAHAERNARTVGDLTGYCHGAADRLYDIHHHLRVRGLALEGFPNRRLYVPCRLARDTNATCKWYRDCSIAPDHKLRQGGGARGGC